MLMPYSRPRGFTIVELLIVIVVIAILAAISVVAYTGIQERATNATTIDAASSTFRAIQAYIAANGTYPPRNNGYNCVTTSSGCRENSNVIGASSAFDTAIQTLAAPPRSINNFSTAYQGVMVYYLTSVTFEGASQPMFLIYYLSGINQQCGLSNVMQYSFPNTFQSTTGYTYNHVASNLTFCWVSIPGPSV